MEKTMEKIVQVAKSRGFVYPGSEIYGGLANTWDYGNLGVELKNNVKRAWWQKFIQENPYNVGVDCAILMNPQTWVASGHLGGFSDPLMDCKECKERFRADQLIENFCEENGIALEGSIDAWSKEEMESFVAEHKIPCPSCGKHNFTDIRQFNLMFKTFQGVTEDAKNTVYLRPETAQGIGTMTYMDGEGNFGALGHGIADVDTSDLMSMDDGTLYMAEVMEIKKGAVGNPGEMTGLIVYSNDRILGDIYNNCERGIFGHCNAKASEKFRESPVPIGLKQEIVKGPARILCTVDGAPKYYDIEITDINLNHSNVNRGIELTVVDENLLNITGGIVQGMSGSPILQNGKIVGAVTHVLVNDPTRGYGIFIENMFQH